MCVDTWSWKPEARYQKQRGRWLGDRCGFWIQTAWVWSLVCHLSALGELCASISPCIKWKDGKNSIYLIQKFAVRFNCVTQLKHLKQCLIHIQCLINISYYQYTSVQMPGDTWPPGDTAWLNRIGTGSESDWSGHHSTTYELGHLGKVA